MVLRFLKFYFIQYKQTIFFKSSQSVDHGRLRRPSRISGRTKRSESGHTFLIFFFILSYL